MTRRRVFSFSARVFYFLLMVLFTEIITLRGILYRNAGSVL
jgi:hypothetical protein